MLSIVNSNANQSIVRLQWIEHDVNIRECNSIFKIRFLLFCLIFIVLKKGKGTPFSKTFFHNDVIVRSFLFSGSFNHKTDTVRWFLFQKYKIQFMLRSIIYLINQICPIFRTFFITSPPFNSSSSLFSSYPIAILC